MPVLFGLTFFDWDYLVLRQLDQISLVEFGIWFFGKGQALTIREEKENFIIALLKNFKEDTP